MFDRIHLLSHLVLDFCWKILNHSFNFSACGWWKETFEHRPEQVREWAMVLPVGRTLRQRGQPKLSFWGRNSLKQGSQWGWKRVNEMGGDGRWGHRGGVERWRALLAFIVTLAVMLRENVIPLKSFEAKSDKTWLHFKWISSSYAEHLLRHRVGRTEARTPGQGPSSLSGPPLSPSLGDQFELVRVLKSCLALGLLLVARESWFV